MLEKAKRERISHEVIKTLFARFDSFPDDTTTNRNAPFHERFLNAFADRLKGKVTDIPVLISLASWAHGLNTSLGQSFFERISHILSNGYKKTFHDLKITKEQQEQINLIVVGLSNKSRSPNFEQENAELTRSNEHLTEEIADFTVDCYLEDEQEILAIELKSVRPNKNISKEEKTKNLNGRTALRNLFPRKKVNYYLGFPFDPFSHTATGSDKLRFIRNNVDLKSFYAPVEILIAEELWDHLSGTRGTMQSILDIINGVATPNFKRNLEFINEATNRDADADKYRKILQEWNLHSEIILLNAQTKLIKRIANDKQLKRIFNQSLFRNGEYNRDRRDELMRLLQ